MKMSTFPLVIAVFGVFSLAFRLSAAPPEGQKGKPIKLASIYFKDTGSREKNLEEALNLLRAAGEQNVEIACLPEDFLRTGGKAEAVPGPATDAVAEVARKCGMCVICPLYELAGERRYNSAVLIGRDGKIVGTYRKVYPYWGEHGVTPGEEVKVFETDFGRIAILTCFDINFPPLWDRADELGAEVVFWPSAYSGGIPFRAYSMLHNYYIVTSTQNGDAMFVDITGEVICYTRDASPPVTVVSLDLDRTLFHENFNGEKMQRLLREQEGKVTIRHFTEEQWYLIEAAAPGVSVRQLAKEYGLETLRDYRSRSRRQIDAIRQAGEALK